MAYEEMNGLFPYLRSTGPGSKPGTARWFMYQYLRSRDRGATPIEAWNDLQSQDLTPDTALEAIYKQLLPEEIYPRAETVIEQAGLTIVEPHTYRGYRPKPNICDNLLNQIPAPTFGPEYGILKFCEWTVRDDPPMSSVEAWERLEMSPDHARKGIERSIVPGSIYPLAKARAEQVGGPIVEPEHDVSVRLAWQARDDLLRIYREGSASSLVKRKLWGYWQRVHESREQTPEQGWAEMQLSESQMREALAGRFLPPELLDTVRQVLDATGHPPATETVTERILLHTYQPIGNLEVYLAGVEQDPRTAEGQVSILWHRVPSPTATIADLKAAWQLVTRTMSPRQADDALKDRIVPLNFHAWLFERAAATV